jgi:hypothetical protein
MREVKHVLAGSTVQLTLRPHLDAPVTAIHSALFDRSGALVSSATAISTGTHFFANHALPAIPERWYTNRWTALTGANTYVFEPTLVHVYAITV